MSQHFTSGTFKFIRDLRANNNRDWFKANKDRYDGLVKEPALGFIVEFGSRLHQISPHFLADPRPHGGSLFRIYRDIRFSKNKDPYKNHVGIHFRHEGGKDVHTPGYYLNLEPRNCWLGLGLWRPDTPTLKLIRDALVADPEAWTHAVGQSPFHPLFKVQGDSLKRPPRGYDPQHPLVETLKLKDFTAVTPLTQKQVTSPDFVDQFAKICAAGSPLVQFICRAIGQPF